MKDFSKVPEDGVILATAEALRGNNFNTIIAQDAAAAVDAVKNLIPAGAEVLASTSKTLEALKLDALFNESGKYKSVRGKLNAMAGDPAKKHQQRRLGAAPEYVVGSVHAVTQDGHVLVASATGSQLASYLYGAQNVVWVIGVQKIVANWAEAEQRLKEYIFPLENNRSQAAYGMGSAINKLVHYYAEGTPGRVNIVLIKQALGF